MCPNTSGMGQDGGARQLLLSDQPVEESAHRAEQMVVASRLGPGPGGHERLDKFWRHLLEAQHMLLAQVAIEEAQRAGLGVIASAQRPFVGDKPRYRIGQRTL